METLGFTPAHQDLIWRIIGAILLLGNVNFQIDKTHTAVGESKVSVTDFSLVETIANLLECDPYRLKDALISRQISTGVSRRMSVIHIHLDEGQAKFTRDALAKALYSLLFTWLVEHINKTIHANVPRAETLVIGVLDIYGFEIFEKNSFEQFCINYCNEKLQQLFIELTLKTEQEEYVREGIKWTPVEYFNNKIICDLIDGKPLGVVSLLDESCLVANSTDISFLDKMNRNFKHKHYESYGTTNNRQIPSDAFRLKHYAGDVTYCVEGFLEKNKDTLFVDLINAMLTTKNAIFPELFKSVNTDTKKRPVTAGTQFKTSLAELVDTLLKCRPHYTRCIKPNANKRPGVLDEALVRHQIRYLGLVENLRVRRAGFANRQTYDRFLRRYKMLATATWPRWRGDDQTGSQAIIDEVGLPKDEYSMGKTKVFIKNPTTVSHSLHLHFLLCFILYSVPHLLSLTSPSLS
jgi:myosin-1